MCMTRKITKIYIKSYFHTTAILLYGFFDSVDFRLNRVGSRSKTAQSLYLQLRYFMLLQACAYSENILANLDLSTPPEYSRDKTFFVEQPNEIPCHGWLARSGRWEIFVGR